MRTNQFIYSLVLITISLGIWSAFHLPTETDINAYNLASNKDISAYKAFTDSLSKGKDKYSIVILEKQTGWETLSDFRVLKEIISFWASQSGIGKVSSLVDLDYPKQGILRSRTVPFLDLGNRNRFEKRVEKFDLFQDILQKFLAENRKYTLAFLETSEGISSQSAEAFEELDFSNWGIEIHYLQYDLIQKELESYLQKDTILLGAISLLLILSGFYFFTHSLKGLALITLLVAFNISATFIAMWLLNMSFTMHMITIPCIIIVLSFTDIMHILYFQNAFRSGCETDRDLRQKIISEVKKPLLLTSLTNIIGFVMFLILADNIHLLNYSLASIIGVASAYFSSRFLVIRLMDRESLYIRRTNFQWIHAVHQTVFQYLLQRRKLVLSTFLVINLLVISFVVSTFKIDNADKDFSISNANLNQGKEIVEAEFFGRKQAEIFITVANGTIWNQPILDKIQLIENEITEIFEPLYINSPTLIVKRYSRYTSGGQAEAFFVPKKLGKRFTRDLAKYKTSLGGEGIIATQSDQARIVFGFGDQNLETLRGKYAKIRNLLAQKSSSEVSFELAGLQYLSDEATYSFSNKILIGFGVSVLFSSLFILFLLKSIRTSLGLLFVNLFPIFVALGLIILLEISITPLTLFLLSILLGVCVDDSIYLVTQSKHKSNAIHILPIFITSFVLSLGFLSLSFSSFTWVKPFGWIFLIGIALAYFLDIFILMLFLDKDTSFEETSDSSGV
jgi:predicted RND superfamily exporter protein